MNKQTAKLTIREIKGSFGRYMAIFAIIALGAGLFVGLRMSKPDFIKTYDRYLHETNFYNFRLVSTLGLTQDDVDEVLKLDGVKDAEGVVSADFLYNQSDDKSIVIAAQEIPEKINLIDLKAGRMPQKGNECLADPEMYTEDDIGKTVKLSKQNSEQTMDTFAYDEYTIVGLTESVLYINLERGSSTLGSGSVEGYIYLPSDGFSVDYFTDIYVTVDAEGYVYSDEYKDNAKTYVKPLEQFMAERAVIRYNSIIDEANEKLADAKAHYQSGLNKYEPAKAEYESGVKQLKTEKANAEAKLAKAKKQLDDAEKMLQDPSILDEKQAELDAAKAKLDKGKAEYESGLKQFETRSKSAYLVVDRQIKTYTDRVENRKANIAQINTEIEELNAELEAAEANGEILKAASLRTQIRLRQSRLETNERELERAEKNLATAQAKKAEIDAELAPYKKQLDDAKTELDSGYAQVNAGQAELDKARKQLEDAPKQIAQGRAQYEKSKQQMETEFAKAEKKLAAGKKQLDAAKSQLDYAKAQLTAAEKQIKNMEHADTYVLGRDTNIGYVCLSSDIDVVQSVAGVFPAFFFLVAALVCLTTMTRMIDDQRTQIGIMKALGYSSSSIMLKYMVYSGSATLFGSIFGIAVGAFAFPAIVWFGYDIIYNFSSLVFTMDWALAFGMVCVNLLGMLLVTWFCCVKELKCAPSDLIRPKAPEAGKRILLERIGFIWNRLSFMQKVSARNVFRYKKRIFMMLLGIGGCTALVLTAFGLNDTIQGVVDKQYSDIVLYDYEVSLAYDMTADEQKVFLDDCGDNVAEAMFLYRTSADVSANGSTKSVTLTASNGQGIGEFINLVNDGEAVAYPKAGEAIINCNLARMMDIDIGDEIKLTTADMDTLTVKVSGIFDNYVENLVFVNLDTCTEQWGSAPELKAALLKAPEGADVSACGEKISSVDGVRTMQMSISSRDRISNMMSSLLFVVAMIILCAGLLALIVLYNLTNINISERIREIATIKVLGFYPHEAASYVFRENLVLTGMGALFGLLLGVALHAFIMDAIKVDMMYFKPMISPLSFAFAVLLTFGFALLVNAIMRRRIDNIDMAGALKSIE